MNYLSLLPENVHEDIYKRVVKDEEYDIEFDEKDDNMIYLSTKINVPVNVQKIFYEKNCLRYKARTKKTFIFYVQKCKIENNIFICEYRRTASSINKGDPSWFVFKGDNRIYFSQITDYFSGYFVITDEANEKLIKWTKKMSNCQVCNKKKDDYILTNIGVSKLNIIVHESCISNLKFSYSEFKPNARKILLEKAFEHFNGEN